MTGYERASRIRETPAAPGATFIALTGYGQAHTARTGCGQAHDRVNSKAAGFDHHRVKRVYVERLIALVAVIGPPREVLAG